MQLKFRTIACVVCAFITLAIASLMHNDGVQVTAEENTDQQAQPTVNMQLSPVTNRISLEPGQELTDSFTIENTGSADFQYKVYAAPY